MKKYIILFICLLLTFNSFAQYIPMSTYVKSQEKQQNTKTVSNNVHTKNVEPNYISPAPTLETLYNNAQINMHKGKNYMICGSSVIVAGTFIALIPIMFDFNKIYIDGAGYRVQHITSVNADLTCSIIGGITCATGIVLTCIGIDKYTNGVIDFRNAKFIYGLNSLKLQF